MSNVSFIQLRDDRTGRQYAVNVFSEEHKDFALKKLQEKMDYDYIESLPAKSRAEKKKHSLDFTCPFCREKTEISSRKEKIVSGFLFFINTEVIDIYKCRKCEKEFKQQELYIEKERTRRNNNIIENFENWKDAKRQGKNPPEFISLDKVDEVIISSF